MFEVVPVSWLCSNLAFQDLKKHLAPGFDKLGKSFEL